MNRIVKTIAVAALGLGAFAASCAMGPVAHAAGLPAANLIHELLHLYYANVSGIRHQLIAFYTWQQPGLSRDVIARYVRSLIINYPHAMHSCMAALHEHRHALAVQVCP